MTKKEKFDKSLELLKQSSELFDKAQKLLKSIGIITYDSTRPIEYYDPSNKKKPTFYIYKGIKKVAEVNGTELQDGCLYFAQEDERYQSTMVDDILFHELVV